jgi:HEAT repeat protein
MRARAGTILLVCALSARSSAQVTGQAPGGSPATKPFSGGSAHASQRPGSSFLQPTEPLGGPRDRFSVHFGVDAAALLLHSTDPDERLRGIERAASIGTPEAVSLLIHAAREPLRPEARDTRALILIVRGLAGATNQSEVRSFLKDDVLNATMHQRPASSTPEPDAEEGDGDARMALARAEAALALATSPDPRAIEEVLRVARDPGPGQAAAAAAIVAFPPEKVAAIGTGSLSPELLRLAAGIGDLRALDGVRAALHAPDGATRAAALDAISDLGDARAVPDARLLVKDPDPLVREAAVRALIRLGASGGTRELEALIGDDDTALAGTRMALLTSDAGVAQALAARVKSSGDPELRATAIAALGRSTANEAAQALLELASDPLLSGDVAAALARSPSARSAVAIQSLLQVEPTRRLGARAYIVRARTRREETEPGNAILSSMAASHDPRERAVGLGGLVLLGKRDAEDALRDSDARVRQAVAMAAMADPRARALRALLAVARDEKDPLARRVEMAGLLGGDAEGLVTTVTLAERAEAGEEDALLAAMALAARGDPAERERLARLVGATDPLLRAHIARGLGRSKESDATGRLAEAFRFEVAPIVRRAIILALAGRPRDAGAPALVAVLRSAARLDPDRAVREAASGARGLDVALSRGEVAWLRLTTPAGEVSRDSGRGGVVVGSDGLAIPIAFDADGYALVPVPPGEARLLLEARIPAYE